jgi:hypothetical protein
MRLRPDDKLWVVTDPTGESETADICFETTVRGLLLQLKGGLDVERNVTLFTDGNEAEIEAYGRLVAMRAARVIAQGGFKPGDEPSSVEITGPDGKVLFRADLGGRVR